MRRSRIALVGLLALWPIAACGGEDTGPGGAGPGGVPGAAATEQTVERCLDEAQQIPQPSARRTAEEACRAVETGDQSKVRKRVQEQCLEAARDVPLPDARRRAEQACRRAER